MSTAGEVSRGVVSGAAPYVLLVGGAYIAYRILSRQAFEFKARREEEIKAARELHLERERQLLNVDGFYAPELEDVPLPEREQAAQAWKAEGMRSSMLDVWDGWEYGMITF